MSKWIKYKEKIECVAGWILLYIYFFALDSSYLVLLADKVEPFGLDISVINICVGLMATTLLYFLWSKLDCQKPSVFLFGIVFIVMYVPVVAVYGMMNFDNAYFFMLTICMLITVILLILDDRVWFQYDKPVGVSVIMGMDGFIPCLLAILTIVIALVFIFQKGFPSTTAFNIYDVYKLRSDSFFIKNRYMNYIFSWICKIVLPFLISVFLVKKRHFLTLLFSLIDFLFYLYSGEKVVLFTLLIIYTIFILVRLGFTGSKFIYIIMVGLSSMCFAGMLGFNVLYDILIRRTLFLPAHLKFLYYEFFSSHTKVSLGGTLWGSIFGIKMQYPDGIGKTISRFFFHNDAMNSNTGFMAEGFYRFGFLGLILVFLLLYFLLKITDYLSMKTSHNFAIVFAICPVYMLNDGSIIDSIIFGPLTIFIIICLFYYDYDMRNSDMNDVNYIREVNPRKILTEIWKKKIAIVTVFILVVAFIFSAYYIAGHNAKIEKPCYTYYLEAYYDYDFESDSIMNYAGILDEQSTVNDVANYSGLLNFEYNKGDNSINISPRAKDIVSLTIIGKDKSTVSKIAQGYKYYALPKLRDNIGAKKIEIMNTSNKIEKIKIMDYVNDGKPGLIKINKSINTESWDDYLHHKTSFIYFIKQGITAGLIAVLIFALIIAIHAMYDRKIRSPRDVKDCIGNDVFAIIDDAGEGVDYLAKRMRSLSRNGQPGDNQLFIVPIKIQSRLLDHLRHISTHYNFSITDSADKSESFLDSMSYKSHVIIAIGYESVNDVELINLKEVLTTAGAETVGVAIVGTPVKEIRRSDEYFGKYFNNEEA